MLAGIKDDYNVEESWRRSTANKIDFVSVIPLKQDTFKSGVSTMRMKDIGTNILNYDSVKEFKDFLQTDKEFCTCVIDNIVGMYGKSLKLIENNLLNSVQSTIKIMYHH